MKKYTKLTAIILSALLVTGAFPFAASAAESDSVGVTLLGDVNGDGVVDVIDATAIQKHSAGIELLDDSRLDVADVNGDDKINVVDATLIQSYAAGFDTGYAIGEPMESTEATDPTEATEATESTEATEATQATEATEATEPAEVTGDEWKENTGTIVLSDSGITVTGTGAYVDGNTVIITEGGDWEVTGTCSDGMIYVNTGEEKEVNDKVKLRLNGMSLTNPDGPAIYFDRCKKAFITLESGTTNTVTDGAAYTATAEEHTIDGVTYSIDASAAKGAIHTDDTLEIKGKGTLVVNGNYKHGIATDDDISIENGVFQITSVKDGIHANDDITVNGKNVSITINTQSDGLDSEGTLNLELLSKLTVSGAGKAIKADGDITITAGTYICDTTDDCINGNAAVTINGGSFTLSSGDDGVTAVTALTISGGTINITQAGGKGIKADGDITLSGGEFTVTSTDDCINGNANVYVTGGSYTLSSGDEGITAITNLTIENADVNVTATGKGVKAETDLYINSGTLTVNSTDDCVHSNANITITGGTLDLTSGDDGVHADTTLTIEDGSITVNKSYEGLEANDIIINGGTIYVVASDDGLNAAGGNDQSSQGGRPGQNQFQPGSSSNSSITINGGYIFVVASGDGVDSNGALTVSGGTTVVQGPANGGNFAVDCDGTVNFTGGTLMAIASANAMWEDISGKLGNAVYNKSVGTVSKNGTIAVTDSSGNVLSIVKSQLSGSVGVLYYTANTGSLTSCKAVVGGTYSGSFDSFGYATGGTLSGGTSATLSQSSSGGGGGFNPGGPGGR